MKKSNQIKRLLLSLMPIQALAVGLPGINSLLNSFIIGHYLGSQALAAMAFIAPLDLVIVFINVVLSNGAQVISGKYLGKGDKGLLKQVFNTTLIVALVVGVFVSALSFLMPNTIARLLGAKDEILPLTADFIRGAAPGYVFAILFACFLPFIQLERASIVSTLSVTTLLIVNTGGNILNAVVFNGGTFGSGVATASANFASVLVGFPFFVFKSKLFKLSPKSFSIKTLRSILLYGYPVGIPYICNSVRGAILNNALFAVGGATALAALTIANNITNSLGNIIEGGYTGGLNLISSVLVGERDVESLRALPKQGIMTAYPIYVVGYLLILILAKPFALLCGAEPEYITVYVTIICLFNAYFFTNSFKAMSVAIYQALNRHKFLTVFSIFNSLIYPSIFIFAGVYLFDSVALIAISSTLAEVCSVVITFTVYYYIRRKRLPHSIFRMTDIPSSLSLPSEERYNRTLEKLEDVSSASEGLIEFCKGKGLSQRDSKLCGLCVEEMAVVSLQNNLEKSKRKNFSIDLRVLHEEDGIAIMLRDNGLHFDPKEWLELYDNKDPMRSIGVKYVVKQAKEITYNSTLGLNVVLIKI